MNFKIESKTLNITNYPSVERHFENMASKGWLITKIIYENIFIYKKINPEKLEFSISPYEVETMFTKKSREELKEFQTVCESVGWNYATKYSDFHIYFKEKGSQAIEIDTDEEEEFKTLEKIGRKWTKNLHIQIPIFLMLCWIFVSSIFNDIYAMKSGMSQIISIFIPLVTLSMIKLLINIKSFLNKNKKNIDLGKKIEYSSSNFYFEKTVNILTLMFLALFLIYALYESLALKNHMIWIGIIPSLIGITAGVFYSRNIKTSKKTLKSKKKILFLVLIGVFFVSSSLAVLSMIGSSSGNKDSDLDLQGYKVISVNDFNKETLESEEDLRKSISFLTPVSYDYTSYNRKSGYITTEYLQALTEGLAKNLVKRYKKQAENRLVGRYSLELDYSYNENKYDDYLLKGGLTEEDFNKLRTMDIDNAIELSEDIIREKSIVKDKIELWNVDEVYFLNYEKTEIVLRSDKEVFYLEGKDFSDSEVRNISKNRLKLLVK